MTDPVPGGTPEGPGPASVASSGTKKVRFRRTRKVLGRIPHPPLHSKRGIALLVGGTALVVAGVVGGAMWFVPYSESVAFCTTCHTMIPQQKAFEASSHTEVPCGECHVEPTVAGWLKAKIAGTNELKALILNNYPTPIPPIEHSKLPSTDVTCMKCHSLDRINTPGNPIKLILRPRYETDRANTMQMVAVAIRPTGLGSTTGASPDYTEQVDTSSGESTQLEPRGVHWHVAEPVAVYATDGGGQTIPLVEYQNENGDTESFVAATEISSPSDVAPDITRLKSTTEEHTMNCIDCHNMVGHNIPNPSVELDSAMSEGTVSPELPFIKRDALDLIQAAYPTEEIANDAIDAFGASYEARYPLAVRQNPGAIEGATEEIRRIYEETATPAMKTVWDTYPDNLGHQRSPGCFRCHDGAHVKVVDGVATDEVIPSTCSTCHTFPQVGTTVSGLQLGIPPETHSDPLYVFNHKTEVPSVQAAFSTNTNANCATCHQETYCENCHNTGAVNVNHDEMLYNHAESVRKSSLTACAYCHQPVYCATCHPGNPLGDPSLSQVRLNTQGDGAGDVDS